MRTIGDWDLDLPDLASGLHCTWCPDWSLFLWVGQDGLQWHHTSPGHNQKHGCGRYRIQPSPDWRSRTKHSLCFPGKGELMTLIEKWNPLQMFTNAGNSEFSRDFYLQTDYDKTALDDIYGRYIEQKKTHLSLAAEANASAADIFARSRFCGWRARAQGSGAITFTRVLFKNQSALFFNSKHHRYSQQTRQTLEV